METGRRFTMPEHKTKEQKSSLNLSIHISVGGLSFFTQHSSTKQIVSFHKKSFPTTVTVEKLHEEIYKELKNNNLIGQTFHRVLCSVENNLATLVPKSLFEHNALHQYINKDIDVHKNDFITHDSFDSTDWVTVYVPFVNVNNMLIDAFGSFTYFHAVSIWIHALSKHPTSDGDLTWSLYKEGSHIHLVLLRDKALQFYNCFEANNPKDVVYYTLLMANKNNISPSEVPLFVAGDILAEDPTFNALYDFIRSINFLSPQNETLNKTPRLDTHQDFCLLNLD